MKPCFPIKSACMGKQAFHQTRMEHASTLPIKPNPKPVHKKTCATTTFDLLCRE